MQMVSGAKMAAGNVFGLGLGQGRCAAMPRLRRSDCSTAGIRRVRRGRGFAYLDADGRRLDDPETLARIQALAIPPAWQDVWICPFPNGHIQAIGTDARGRKQYRYHDAWRLRRDREKFEAMLDFARALPRLRKQAAWQLRAREPSRERVLAGAVRLLDRGFFRVGGEQYAEENETYGLATMLKRHVRLEERNVLVFDYVAKSGKRRLQSIVDPDVYRLVAELKGRRGGGPELLAYRDGRRWRDVRSSDINEHVKELAQGDFSAKDFRTWNATVLAAVALAVSGRAAASPTARKRAKARAVQEVSFYLGNTPAVCRASYIDPRVFDSFARGFTIGPVLAELGADEEATAIQGPAEVAVLDLLEGVRSSEYVERVP
jgi:DNA topoisomerase IB